MSEIKVEVRPRPGMEGDLGGGRLSERFADRVNELAQSLGKIANQLRAQLEAQLSAETEEGWRLDEIQLQFSLDLEAEAGVVLARASTTAGFEASMSWRRS